MKSRIFIVSCLALFSAISIMFYLEVCRKTYRAGFPLDDAWIHQTYARNLSISHRWEFIPGQPSAGSTSPLWSAMLATGYALGVSPEIWSAIIGWISLTTIASIGGLIYSRIEPNFRMNSVLIAMFMICEWHLVWSAVSGMETLLFVLIILFVFLKLISENKNWFILGVLIGTSVWIRPDGITLLFPVLLVLLTSYSSWNQRFIHISQLFSGILLLVVPYALFNFQLSGYIWPNTFFAKQVEYKSLTQIPLWKRALSQLSMPVIGAGALLVPGFCTYCIDTFRQKKWVSIAAILWMFSFIFMYAIRLPVTYQHGRYIIPVMPIFFITGLTGVLKWVKPDSKRLKQRLVSKVWLTSIAIVILLFWIRGGKTFAVDVAIIESEMVDTANWIKENTEQEALIAAHDIGALGYYGNRKIIDLAGLISPEIIPFIRDESKIEAFLNEKGAAYLVTFPGWYPLLTDKSQLIFQTEGVFSPFEGGENMAVYRWIEH